LYTKKKFASHLDILELDKRTINTNLFDGPPVTREKVFRNIEFNSTSSQIHFMLDYTQRKYLYMNDATRNVLGFNPNYFIQNGMESYLEKLDPVGLSIFQKKIFATNIEHIRKNPAQKAADFIFTHSFRINTPNGDRLNIAQRSSFIVTPDGNPVGVIGCAMDISWFKKDDSVVHVIEDRSAPYDKRILLENHYFPNLEDTLLSNRELEVLRWITEGLSSKQIAFKMNISINTVNNHRVKMLRKTNCKNAVDLVNYAIRNNLL
jgi:DNA-binding CsgD family transcriptional regulator